MSAAVDLRAELSAAAGTDRVHQNTAPQDFVGPYVWFGFAGSEDEAVLGSPAGERAFSETYDVECVADSADGSEQLARSIRTLNLHRGNFGAGGTVQGVFVSNQPADYVTRGDNSDEGLHVSSLRIEVAGYNEG